MAENFEEQYLDVLQNIEFALVNVYRAHATMTDYDALAAITGLIRTYQAEVRGRSVPALRLAPLAQEAYERVKTICEWRLGRAQMADANDQPIAEQPAPLTADEISACLKRIRRSIETWNKRGGSKGYYDFVSQFVR